MSAPTSLLPLRLHEIGFRAGGKSLLEGVSLALEAGPKTVVLGPNGAGKSLLLRIAHGLLDPSAGEVRWNVPPPRRGARGHAMVFERPVLLRRSALANVTYALSLAGVPRRDRHARALDVLERTGLAALAARPARVLSAGEQQRLALARGWALEPQVLFLDEPTAPLDPSATRAIEALIEAIAAAGTKIVMTTHDLGQARRLADEVVFLHRGRLRECGPAERFFAGPECAEAGAFLDGRLVW